MFLHRDTDLDTQQVLDLVLADDPVARLTRLRGPTPRPPARPLDLVQGRAGATQALVPGLAIGLFLLRAPVPQDPIPVGRAVRAFRPVVHHTGTGAATRVGLPMHLDPLYRLGPQVLAEPRLLVAGPGHDRQEPPVSRGRANALKDPGQPQVIGHFSSESAGIGVPCVEPADF
ncbi:hypothetical protein C1280_16370 [Gemmata obscuriglobus]|uniref:Uncharacterized protein n=1 Tax=Gemmata obscuriglobus TaxID=114 RepID=A0A2Z3GYA1_9BACT|nr:hypothetical protein C1280_16370 [Gemmata obscuriglobus]